MFSYHTAILNTYIKKENPCIYKENCYFPSKYKGIKISR